MQRQENPGNPNDGKVNGIPTLLQDYRKIPDSRIIREDTLENDKKWSDKERTDSNDLSRARDGPSDRVLPPTGRTIAAKPGSLHKNETERVGSARFNCFLIVTTTRGFLRTNSIHMRIMLRSALGSKHIQWQLHKHSAQATRQRKTANQRLEPKATSRLMVQSQGRVYESLTGANRSLGNVKQYNRGTRGK